MLSVRFCGSLAWLVGRVGDGLGFPTEWSGWINEWRYQVNVVVDDGRCE